MDETIRWEDLPQFMAEIRMRARALLQTTPVSLQATELVNSAVRRLLQTTHDAPDAATWENREHFLATLYLAMRAVVIDHARRRLAQRRDVRQTRRLEDLDSDALLRAVEASPEDVIALQEVLAQLEQEHPVWAAIIKDRFLGLTMAESAQVRGLSERTIKRIWDQAQKWCLTQVWRDEPPSPGSAMEEGPPDGDPRPH